MEYSHQMNIGTHVSVEDMTEFVGDDALELIPGKVVDGPPIYADYRIGRGVTGSKRIDAFLLLKDVDGGDGCAGCQRHFLNYVHQPPFSRVVRVRLDQPSAQHVCNRCPATAKFDNLVETAESNHQQRAATYPEEQLGLPESDFATLRRTCAS